MKVAWIVISLIVVALKAEALGKKTFGNGNQTTTTGTVSQSKGGPISSNVKVKAQSLPTSAKGGNTEVLKYADSGVGSPYHWGGSRWSVNNRKILGADCSGFTQKAWGYPNITKTDEAIPGAKRLTTREFLKAQDGGYPWIRLDKSPHSDAQAGDAMVYRGNDNGHIFLVSNKDNSGVVTVEARGKKYGIGYSRKSYAYLKNKGYKTLRRK